MKTVYLCIFLLSAIFVVTCQIQPVNSNNGRVENSQLTQESKRDNKSTTQIEENNHYEIWVPDSIEKCISKVKFNESFEIMKSINPFYLRANFDGNNTVDYVILIQGQITKKTGAIICKDSNECFVFGAIADSKTPVSSFENDNFITTDWEILTKSETQNLVDTPGGRKVASDAQGESVGFLFEGGGSVFIYWDGKIFRVVEGA
jgi:hypothetical protein